MLPRKASMTLTSASVTPISAPQVSTIFGSLASEVAGRAVRRRGMPQFRGVLRRSRFLRTATRLSGCFCIRVRRLIACPAGVTNREPLNLLRTASTSVDPAMRTAVLDLCLLARFSPELAAMAIPPLAKCRGLNFSADSTIWARHLQRMKFAKSVAFQVNGAPSLQSCLARSWDLPRFVYFPDLSSVRNHGLPWAMDSRIVRSVEVAGNRRGQSSVAKTLR